MAAQDNELEHAVPAVKREGWAVLELLGHRTRPGYIQEEILFGVAFVRVDTPWADPAKGTRATEHYRPSSVYGIRWVDESVVRAALAREERYETPTTLQLPSSVADDFDDQDDDEQLDEVDVG